MVHIEWYPFRKPSRMFFRILIYTGGEAEMEITKANLFLCLKEWDGLSGATAEGEWFLWGPPEAVGNTDFLSSQSPHTSQGPETTSSQILIWMWALKVLVKNQIVNLRLLVPFRRKEQLPRQMCVYAHIQEWLA